MSFQIRLRSLSVSTRACTSCLTRTITSHCQPAEFFIFRLTMTGTRLIHYCSLCSSCIGPGPFALLSKARLLPTLNLFEAFFTIGAKDFFFAAVFMRRAGNKIITLLKLSKIRRCRTVTRWQGWFGLTIQVESELLRNSNQIMLCFGHA